MLTDGSLSSSLAAWSSEEVIIKRRGTPVVRLVAMSRKEFRFGTIPLTEARRADLTKVDWDAPAFPAPDPFAPIP
jgi:antitoxin (DNA-binding transcriptional repressor) of toxin-antitoxin stability system